MHPAPPAQPRYELRDRILRITGMAHLTFGIVPGVEATVAARTAEFDDVECDLSGTHTIDSAGVGLLLMLQAGLEGRGNLVVTGCHGNVDAILRRMNLHKLVTIRP